MLVRSEVGEHLHGLVFNVSFSRDENKKGFFFIKQGPWNGSLVYFFRVTSQWPQPLRLSCLCLWSDEGEGEGGRDESERAGEGVLYCNSVVRGIPLRLQRAMTCLITFMFDRVHCSLKLAWRKWDFPSQNITLHPSSKPSIKVPYSLPLCQFYRSHQATLGLTFSPTHCTGPTKRHNNDCIPWKSMQSLKCELMLWQRSLHVSEHCRTNTAL